MNILGLIGIAIFTIIIAISITFLILWLKFKKINSNTHKVEKEVKENGRTEPKGTENTETRSSGTENPVINAEPKIIDERPNRIQVSETGTDGTDCQAIKLFKPTDL
jgi:uncharacterized protein YacL